MSEPRNSGWARLSTLGQALDDLPDGVAMAVGVVLGGALVGAVWWAGWWWLSVVVVGLAFLVGRSAGLRRRVEGWVWPLSSVVAVLGAGAAAVVAVLAGGSGETPEAVVAGEGERLMRLDLGGGDTSLDGGDTGSTGSETVGCPSGTVFIEGGEFDGHTVASFCLDETEVQVSRYERCMNEGGCTEAGKASGVYGEYSDSKYCNRTHDDRSLHPMNCVDWHQAQAFCRWDGGKRLPTGWEWEWAARGRDRDWTYPWGEEAPTCDRAVMNEGGSGCGKDRTWPVGSKPNGDSRDGVKDMAGNVWEWTGTERGGRRVLRGGSWLFYRPRSLRGAYRSSGLDPASRYGRVGFRCARTSGGEQ